MTGGSLSTVSATLDGGGGGIRTRGQFPYFEPGLVGWQACDYMESGLFIEPKCAPDMK